MCVFHEINLCANEIVFIVCWQHRTEEWKILQPISYTCVLLKKNLYRNVFFLVSCSFIKYAKGYCKLLVHIVIENHCYFIRNKVYSNSTEGSVYV